MFTLENFYRSSEWEKLREVLRFERTNENGELICWHCGKPITNKYDAIAHHTIFLTEDNVNIAEISLNPDLIRFVHHRCHNKIHNKLGFSKREVFLVYGSPLSGKTTYVNSVKEPGDLIIDIDSIWECVSGCDRYVKPARLNSVVFGVRDYLMDCVFVRRGKWNNCYLIMTAPLANERERICKQLGAREVHIDTSKEECLKRLENCNDGRNKKEWEQYIDEYFRKYNLYGIYAQVSKQ